MQPGSARSHSSLNIGGYPFDQGGIPVKFSVLVERDEDRYYIASVSELPGCHNQAKTLDELTSRVKEAIELYLEAEGAKTEEKIDLIGVQFVEVPTK
ncbi:type II toxin-antitoxin system HicB family antitoxin [Candidatus Bathyarchaeota archaeon]|nr:type II toxin-antitoxin system HicB family antitoxin [Candidatus Bathyarchaeota archaeon]